MGARPRGEASHRKPKRTALEQSEERYLALTRLCGQAILIECAEKIVYANRASGALFGTEDGDELLGRTLTDLIPSFVKPLADPGADRQPPLFTSHALALADGQAIDVDIASDACSFRSRNAVQMVVRPAKALLDTNADLRGRVAFRERVVGAIASTERSGKLLAVMMLGIDHPHSTEESREAIDRLLEEVAGRVARDTRKSDTITTIGRNEFAILIEALAEPELVAMVARRKLDAVSRRPDAESAQPQPTASIGVALLTRDVCDAEGLIGNAERALWAARNAGGNTYRLHSAAVEDDARRHGGPRPETSTRLERLTPREHEVLDMLVLGNASKMIAHLLGTSTRTIDIHRARVMEKMCADSVAALVTMVVEERAIDRSK